MGSQHSPSPEFYTRSRDDIHELSSPLADIKKSEFDPGSATSSTHNGFHDVELALKIQSSLGKRLALEEENSIPFWQMITNPAVLTSKIICYQYPGDGTFENPYVVDWMSESDPRNPMEFSTKFKMAISLITAATVLSVSFASSAFTGALTTMLPEFHLSVQMFTLGVSLFVLGFAVGPLLWAPLSELYGRQIIFITTFGAFTLFNCVVPAAQNIETVLVLRFFAGAFGSSPLTNAAGVVSDIFPANQRGQALAAFALAPFMGPVIGPIAGNYLGEHAHWRWVMGLIAAFSGVMWIAASLLVPETYAPYLLRRRAEALSNVNGRVYRSKLDMTDEAPAGSVISVIGTTLTMPWQLLFREPIVLILSIYLAIVYGTLYMLFGAFPIVYMQARGWTPGKSSLPFLAVLIGMVLATLIAVLFGQKFYQNACKRYQGKAPPEARLTPLVIGSFALPIGLFWFAWTNDPTTHWAIPVAAGIPFGFGMILTFLATLNYLIDAYTLYAASVMAASSVLRSLFGAAFPLFTPTMYTNLGLHWASSVPAYMALACIPFPFIILKYGPRIRERCKYAAKSREYTEKLENERAARTN